MARRLISTGSPSEKAKRLSGSWEHFGQARPVPAIAAVRRLGTPRMKIEIPARKRVV